jgi:hypothetical protein
VVAMSDVVGSVVRQRASVRSSYYGRTTRSTTTRKSEARTFLLLLTTTTSHHELAVRVILLQNSYGTQKQSTVRKYNE